MYNVHCDVFLVRAAYACLLSCEPQFPVINRIRMEMESGFGLPSARDPMSWLKVKFPKHVTQIVTDVDIVTGVATTSSTSSGESNDDQKYP